MKAITVLLLVMAVAPLCMGLSEPDEWTEKPADEALAAKTPMVAKGPHTAKKAREEVLTESEHAAPRTTQPHMNQAQEGNQAHKLTTEVVGEGGTLVAQKAKYDSRRRSSSSSSRRRRAVDSRRRATDSRRRRRRRYSTDSRRRAAPTYDSRRRSTGTRRRGYYDSRRRGTYVSGRRRYYSSVGHTATSSLVALALTVVGAVYGMH